MIILYPSYNQGDIIILPNGWIFKIIYIPPTRDWYDIEFLYLNQNYIWQPRGKVYSYDFVNLFNSPTTTKAGELARVIRINSSIQVFIINQVLPYCVKIPEQYNLKELFKGFIGESYIIKGYKNKNVSLRS